jgi:hypothetical protein
MTAQSLETTRRLRYLASQIGQVLTVVDPIAGTFTMTSDKDRKTVHATGVAASASAIKTALASIDPTIVNST